MTAEFDLQSVRDQIEAEVRHKRRSGDLPEELERELDREFDRAPARAAGPVAAIPGNPGLLDLFIRAARKVIRLLVAGSRKRR